MTHRGAAGPGRASLDRLHSALPAPRRWMAGRRVPASSRGHRGPGDRWGCPDERGGSKRCSRGGVEGDSQARSARDETCPGAELERAGHPRPADGGDHAVLPGSAGGVVTTLDGRSGVAGTAPPRRPSDRDRPCVHVGGGDRASPYRVLQGGAGGPPGQRAQQDGEPRRRSATTWGWLRTFFERIIDCDYPDAPGGFPIFTGDLPKADEPHTEVPRRPHRRQVHGRSRHRPQPAPPAHRRAPRPHRHARRRARRHYATTPCTASATPTGCASRSGSSTTTARPAPPAAGRPDQRLPGLARTDRHRAARRTRRPPALRPAHHPPLRRTPWPDAPASAMCIPTSSATPSPPSAINRGMSLEAIAALLGHRSPRMTLIYARIADTVVADQYFSATRAVEADDAGREAASPTSATQPHGIGGYSATATAPGPSSSTAGSTPSAKAAASTRPAPSSSPSSAANATTPATTPTSPAPSSTTSSCESSTTTQPTDPTLDIGPSPCFH